MSLLRRKRHRPGCYAFLVIPVTDEQLENPELVHRRVQAEVHRATALDRLIRGRR